MKLLAKHFAKIDCRKNEIVFNLLNVGRKHYMGITLIVVPLNILDIQAKKYIADGDIAYHGT